MVAACGDDAGATDASALDAAVVERDATAMPAEDGGAAAAEDGGPSRDAGGGPPGDCDWTLMDSIAVLEAESMDLTDEWTEQNALTGFTGTGYIGWTGSAFNNDPTHGVMETRVCIAEAGRYRLQWRTRIGAGDDTTEHNDSWVRFEGVADYFGARGPADDESRRYPEPQCEDTTFMSAVRAIDGVTEARCAEGSTRDGWMKVYSSGASDWRWSTRTSDNDAHDIFFEVEGPGVVTLQLAARADQSLIDRIVVHRADLPDATVQSLDLAETPAD